MISYITQINLKEKYVRTTFRKEVSTFVFDDDQFPLVQALIVAAEHTDRQVKKLLVDIIDHFDRLESQHD